MEAPPNAIINLRLRGQGSGPEYDARVDHLIGLPVEDLQHISVVVGDDRAKDAVNLDFAVPFLDSLEYAVKIDVLHWRKASEISLSTLGYRLQTCPNVSIVHYLSAGILDVSTATVDQNVSVRDAHDVVQIHISNYTTELHADHVCRLENITAPAQGHARLRVLDLNSSFQLQLDTIRVFTRLSTLIVTDCLLLGDLNPLNALRSSLEHLSLWRVSVMELDILKLGFRGFRCLKMLSIRGSDILESLSILACPLLTEIEVADCSRFVGIRCQKRQGPWNVFGMANLHTLKITGNHKVKALQVECLPKLRILDVSANRLQDLHIDGATCPLLEHLNITDNDLCDDSCILRGSFLTLSSLTAEFNDFTRVPDTWDGERLPCLSVMCMSRNFFMAPLDLSGFPCLRHIMLDNNHSPVHDRGGQLFRLQVVVSPMVDGTLPAISGMNLMITKIGQQMVSPDRLAVTSDVIDSDGYDSWSDETWMN